MAAHTHACAHTCTRVYMYAHSIDHNRLTSFTVVLCWLGDVVDRV